MRRTLLKRVHVIFVALVALGALTPVAPGANLHVHQQRDDSRTLEIAAARCSAEHWVLRIEANHSTVGFSIPIMGGLTRVTGKFTEIDGAICYDETDLASSSVQFAVQAASVDTGIEMRDRDLGSDKFFDVANTPEITFTSRALEQRGERWMALGDLSMRGVTHVVEIPFVFTGNDKNDAGRPVVGVAFSFDLDRHDYGVGSDWVHSAIPGFLGDEVTVEVFMYTRSGRRLDELTQ